MDVSSALVLREDVLVVPVMDLEYDVRQDLACDDDAVAVTRALSRSPSTIVDAAASELLEAFREPRTIVEAVIRLSRARGLDPDEVLTGAYPLLRRFLDSGHLVPIGNGEKGSDMAAVRPGLARDVPLGSVSIVRALQWLDDTEVYLARTADDLPAVAKVQRTEDAAVAAQLEWEAQVLRHVRPGVSPTLLEQGELTDGRQYLVLEWCPGVDATAAAEEYRREPLRDGRSALLRLCVTVTEAYARLHEDGVLHGDVHPRNVLVDRDGAVRLIDFGFARFLDLPSSQPEARGGVAFFMEPEHAGALLEGKGPPPLSAAGEQHAVAALLYQLLTGLHYQEFNLEPRRMLEQIAEVPPLAFRERGLPAWPEAETVLWRALSKDPAGRFPSLRALAEALENAKPPEGADARATVPNRTPNALDQALDGFLEETALDGPWFTVGLDSAPTASVTYGAAGIAYALYRIAQARDDAALLATADAWACKANELLAMPKACYNEAVEITETTVGRASPYHTPSGVHAVEVLIGRARGDLESVAEAVSAFVLSSQRGHQGLDVTLGKSGTLLLSALLLDTITADGPLDPGPLRELGTRIYREVWEELGRLPRIEDAPIDCLGAAHGWAGFLYAALQWCRASGAEPVDDLKRRLSELAQLAEPAGRGSSWPWLLARGHSGDSAASMPGWCNGTAGYVLLWTLASRVLDTPVYLTLSEDAAWDAWDAPDLAGSLCCGLVGRSYALLNLYRTTGEASWLGRAKQLALRAAREGHFELDYPHSLYKGRGGLAVLAAELERPTEAAMPFFEEEGWQALAI